MEVCDMGMESVLTSLPFSRLDIRVENTRIVTH